MLDLPCGNQRGKRALDGGAADPKRLDNEGDARPRRLSDKCVDITLCSLIYPLILRLV